MYLYALQKIADLKLSLFKLFHRERSKRENFEPEVAVSFLYQQWK